ncbi:MAG: malic enzyme-like NAD(P)-binding protein, partial [Promethearchaeota archaeon]
KGILHKDRTDLQDPTNYKHELIYDANPEQLQGDCGIALEGADVLISASIPGPGVIRKEWISKMADDAVVFALANPIPEIFPWEAIEAGARIVATGRSDFPNQVNNSLCFPGIFRGTLDVRARTITDEMCIAASYALANLIDEIEGGLTESSILPTMDCEEVFIKQAVAVGLKAIDQGLALLNLSEEEILLNSQKIIDESQAQFKILMQKGFIPSFDDYEK